MIRFLYTIEWLSSVLGPIVLLSVMAGLGLMAPLLFVFDDVPNVFTGILFCTGFFTTLVSLVWKARHVRVRYDRYQRTVLY